MTYEINSPTEVLIRVLDPKGAEVARSNPAQPAARVEFTPSADGDYILACEHLNYLSGPNEVYHLSIEPVEGDFNIVLALDRYEAPSDGGTAVLATVNRLNGYAGPVELSVIGPGLRGTTIVPAGQAITFIPLLIDNDAKPGAYLFRVQGRANIGSEEVVRFGTLIDPVKTALGGMPNPPLELLNLCAVAVVEKPAFSLAMTADPEKIEKGKGGKVLVEAIRAVGADEAITIAPLFLPPNVTAVAKPIAKGQTKGEITVTVAPAAAVGPSQLVFRATAKLGGKDFAVVAPPVVIEVTAPRKQAEPKKAATKK